jgi:phospholipid transport system substrate-binding protein
VVPTRAAALLGLEAWHHYNTGMLKVKRGAGTESGGKMRCDRKRRRWLQVGAALCATAATAAWSEATAADPAVKPIRAFYDALLAVMKQAKELGIRGRYDRLSAPIRAAFDLAAMTRIAVGPEWNSFSLADQTALTDNFTRMTIATYASRFDGYSGERFEVEPESEARPTGRIVHTKLIQSNGEPIALNYLLRESGGSWKVVDIYLTGTISELATRRSEFAAILKSGGPGALIASLQQKTDALLRGASAEGAAGPH